MDHCKQKAQQNDIASLPSALDDLLISNAPLFPNNATRVHANIDTVTSRIRALDAHIIAMNASQEAHQTYLRKHEPLLSCIRSVPPEIWAKIFLFAQQQFQETEQTSLSSKSPCIQLGHVCRLWKSVSAGTPRLWSNIIIKTNRLPRADGLLDMLEAWLTASRCCGLFIKLDASVPMWRDDAARDILQRTLALLLTHSHRWISFSLSISLEDFRAVSFKIRNAPILRHLTLDVPHHTIPYGAGPDDNSLLEPNSVPLLQTINITHIIPVGRVLQHLPWSSVMSCSLMCFGTHIEPPELQAFLQKCTSLEHLYISVSSMETLHTTQRASLFELRSLEINTGSSWLLDKIATPAIAWLSLKHLSKYDAPLVESFMSRHTDLKELSITRGPYSGYAKRSILNGFRNHSAWSIQTLEIESYPTEDLVSFLEKLSAVIKGLCSAFWSPTGDAWVQSCASPQKGCGPNCKC